MKVVNIDQALAALRCKLREAKEQKSKGMEAVTNACITILEGMPVQDISEGVCCGECYWYNAQTKRCAHKNGLMGRLRPKMYCSYGSYAREMPPEEDEDFSEFDDDEQEENNE